MGDDDFLGDEAAVGAAVVWRGGYRRCESTQVISRIPRRLTQTPRYQARFDEGKSRNGLLGSVIGMRENMGEDDFVRQSWSMTLLMLRTVSKGR